MTTTITITNADGFVQDTLTIDADVNTGQVMAIIEDALADRAKLCSCDKCGHWFNEAAMTETTDATLDCPACIDPLMKLVTE